MAVRNKPNDRGEISALWDIHLKGNAHQRRKWLRALKRGKQECTFSPNKYETRKP